MQRKAGWWASLPDVWSWHRGGPFPLRPAGPSPVNLEWPGKPQAATKANLGITMIPRVTGIIWGCLQKTRTRGLFCYNPCFKNANLFQHS